MNSNDRKVVFSSGNDEWETPIELYKTLDSLFHFTLDPCATDDNHLAPNWFTKDDNGLKKRWEGNTVFVNYPYSDAKQWLAKIGEESTTSDIVVLCPARTDTKAFHEHVFPKATAILFFKGRLKFLNPAKDFTLTSAPFPSCLIFYCDRDKVEAIQGLIDGYTVYLR